MKSCYLTSKRPLCRPVVVDWLDTLWVKSRLGRAGLKTLENGLAVQSTLLANNTHLPCKEHVRAHKAQPSTHSQRCLLVTRMTHGFKTILHGLARRSPFTLLCALCMCVCVPVGPISHDRMAHRVTGKVRTWSCMPACMVQKPFRALLRMSRELLTSRIAALHRPWHVCTTCAHRLPCANACVRLPQYRVGYDHTRSTHPCSYSMHGDTPM